MVKRWLMLMPLILVVWSINSLFVDAIQNDNNNIIAIDVSPNEPEFAIIRFDGSIEIIDSATQEILQTYNIDIPTQTSDPLLIRQMRYSPSGNKLAISVSDVGFSGAIFIVDLLNDSVALAHNANLINSVQDMSWSPNSASLVLALQEGVADQAIFTSIEILNLNTQEFEELATGFGETVFSVDWNSSDVIAYSIGSHLIFQDVSTGAMIRNIDLDAPILTLHWSPDGTTIATVDSDRIVRIWSPDSGLPLFSTSINVNYFLPISLTWIDNTKFAVSISGVIELWDISSNSQITTIELSQVASGLIFVPAENELIYALPDLVVYFPLENSR